MLNFTLTCQSEETEQINSDLYPGLTVKKNQSVREEIYHHYYYYLILPSFQKNLLKMLCDGNRMPIYLLGSGLSIPIA